MRREYQHRRDGTTPKCVTCRRPAVAMSEAEREKYVAWWLYESGLEVDELIELATSLIDAENVRARHTQPAGVRWERALR